MGAVAALSAVVAALHLGRWASLDYAMDDAWIVARVARTFWQTGVPTFDITRPTVEAVSDPLWTALAVPLVALGLDPVTPLRWLGGLCWVGLVLGACRWGGQRGGVAGAAVVGAVLATSGGLAYHSVSGLETALWAASVVAGAAWAVGVAPAWAGALALVGVAWGRPEAPWTLAGLGALALAHRRPAGPWVVGAVAFAGLVALRLAVYRAWLPNPAYAKPPDPAAGARYVGDWLWSTGGLAPAVVVWHAPRLAAVVAWLALGVALSGGDWMPAHRRLMEASVLLAVGLATAAHTRWAGAAAVAWVALSAQAAWRGSDGAAWYHDALAAVGERANEAQISRIAAFDVGRLGWTFEGSVHDLAGLTDARIGRAPGAHGQKPFDVAWFDAQAPEWVVLTTLNDPRVEAPAFIRAEAAVWAHLDGEWAVVWVEEVGDPDCLLVVERP